MRVISMAWSICGLGLLLTLVSTSITYHPDAQYLGIAWMTAFSALTLLAGGCAIVLGRQPSKHWIHSLTPPWAVLVSIALAVMLLLVLVG